MRTHRSALKGALLLSVLALGCAGAGSSTDAAAPLPQFDAAARGGSVVLDAERLVAWVADADNRAVHHVDLRTRKVRSTDLPGRPEQVARVGETGLAVTLRETNQGPSTRSRIRTTRTATCARAPSHPECVDH